MKLLTIGNPKVLKGQKLGYLTAILHLAPSKMSGYQVCPMATDGCTNACLNTAGRGGMFAGVKTKDMTGSQMLAGIKSGNLVNRIQSARIKRTQMFFIDRDRFMTQLVKEIKAHVKRAEKKNLIPVVRLNGTSDLRWESVLVSSAANAGVSNNIFKTFPDIQFYDYTKIPNRRNLPENYHLTFSLADGNEAEAERAMARGMNVAVVFRNELPETFMNRNVISGDEHDLRFLDVPESVVGLKAKGKAKKDATGFVKDA